MLAGPRSHPLSNIPGFTRRALSECLVSSRPCLAHSIIDRGGSIEAHIFRATADSVVEPADLSARLLFEGEEVCQVAGRMISLRPRSVLLVIGEPGFRARPLSEARGLTVQMRAPDRVPNLAEPKISDPLPPPHLRILEGRAADLAGAIDESKNEVDRAVLVYDIARELERLVREASESVAQIDACTPRVRSELFRKVSLARHAIDDEPHRAWTVSQLARIACISHFHLHRVFSAAFGETPGQYLRYRRLRAAWDMALQTDLPVWQIGARVGFENFSSFVRSFRTAFGISPGALRRVHEQAKYEHAPCDRVASIT